jgi:hypothetical protein
MVNHLSRRFGPELYTTFGIVSPAATHWRAATCTEVGCAWEAHGFSITCDLRTDLGVKQARYIRDKAGRAYTHVFTEGGQVITFSFPAGQSCFVAHRLPLERPAVFVVRNGDHRGAGRLPAARRVFDRPDQWADTFAEHQDKLATAAARG